MSRVVQGWGASQTCAYCHGFAKIPPLIRGSDGKMYLNPDFNMVKKFTVRAEPFGLQLQPGQAHDFAITVPAEEDDLGDMLINELLALYNPDNARNMKIEILSTQTSRTFQNAPIFTTLMMGNAHLSCCMPCCTLVQATNSLLLRVTNEENVPVEVRIAARGKRFLPKSEELRARMLMYWNSIPSYPFWLTLDEEEVVVPGLGSIDATMTVQGTGDFEMKWARCEVLPSGGGSPQPDDILCTLTEQVGRALQSDALPLGSFVATPTLQVSGFPGGLFRAASACHCPPVSQLLKRNTKLRVNFQNTGSDDAIVRLTFAGCFHQVPECPPGRSLDRIRSLEPTIGPLLIPQRDYCPPTPTATAPPMPQAPAPTYRPAPAPAAPAPRYQAPQPQSGGMLQVRTAGGGVYSPQTAGMEYLSKYYQRAPGGGVTAPNAAAHGYVGVHAQRMGLSGMGQVQLQPGQWYYDPVAGAWRQV
jgi:hypothetical protein